MGVRWAFVGKWLMPSLLTCHERMSWLLEQGTVATPVNSLAPLSNFISCHNPFFFSPMYLVLFHLGLTLHMLLCLLEEISLLAPMSGCLLHPILLLRESTFSWDGDRGECVMWPGLFPCQGWGDQRQAPASSHFANSPTPQITYHLWLGLKKKRARKIKLSFGNLR